MRLAALKRNHENDKIFELAECLVAGLLGILKVATNENGLAWRHVGLNIFVAEFKGLELCWEQSNNEPASLTIAGCQVVEDDGSGAYGFEELSKAIFNQQKTHQRKTKKTKKR